MAKAVQGSAVFALPNQLYSETINDTSAEGVLVRKASKIYGVGSSRCPVLQGLDMTVQKGTM